MLYMVDTRKICGGDMTHGSSRFVLRRAKVTRKAQETVKKKWLWERKSLLDWDTDIRAVEDQEAIAADSDAALTAVHTILTTGYRDLRNRTVKNLGMLKLTYCRESAKLALLANLSARGGSYQTIFAEALALKAVWEELEQERNFTEETSLTGFLELIHQIQHAKDLLATTEMKRDTDWLTLNQMVANLEHDNLSWFAAATSIFSKGTIEGDYIRSIIPVAQWKTMSASASASVAALQK